MDDAFIRRMHFTVEFPFPEEDSRLRIWRNIFPIETPLDENIDFDPDIHILKADQMNNEVTEVIMFNIFRKV